MPQAHCSPVPRPAVRQEGRLYTWHRGGVDSRNEAVQRRRRSPDGPSAQRYPPQPEPAEGPSGAPPTTRPRSHRPPPRAWSPTAAGLVWAVVETEAGWEEQPITRRSPTEAHGGNEQAGGDCARSCGTATVLSKTLRGEGEYHTAVIRAAVTGGTLQCPDSDAGGPPSGAAHQPGVTRLVDSPRHGIAWLAATMPRVNRTLDQPKVSRDVPTPCRPQPARQR